MRSNPVLDTTVCDKVCQWLVTGRWFSPGTPVSCVLLFFQAYVFPSIWPTLTSVKSTWFKTFMSESIARYKRSDNQSRNLNWKIISVKEWKCSGNSWLFVWWLCFGGRELCLSPKPEIFFTHKNSMFLWTWQIGNVSSDLTIKHFFQKTRFKLFSLISRIKIYFLCILATE